MTKGLITALKTLAALFIVVVIITVVMVVSAGDAPGASPAGKRLERVQASAQWQGSSFVNRLTPEEGSFWKMMEQWIFGGSEYRVPEEPIGIIETAARLFETAPGSGLRVTWLGHSTLLIEIDGHRLLIDPVWGERASPFNWMGPVRFYEPPLALEDLPDLDAVIISHDHYDHLDHPTVLRMLDMEVPWVVPLGVGAHLEHWGMPVERIVELDWWENTDVKEITITCTPARHFSGRSVMLTDRSTTLWAGWALTGPRHRVYYSGDTAMQDEFIEIGDKLGPFDMTLIESGAYNELWADVHLGPEQAVRAHQLVRGRVMLPVHWGLFNLGMHGWTEPIERILVAAMGAGVKVVMPVPGETVEPELAGEVVPWWPTVPWETAAEAPAQSSAVDHLMADEILAKIKPIEAEL